MASFGDKLRLERETRGVSLREIADATKISVRFLKALEEGRIDVLPGGLFPRAFVKQYAAFLGLDPERLAMEFASEHGDSPSERRPSVPQAAPWRPTPGQLFLVVVALLAVGLTLRRPVAEARRARPAGSSVPGEAEPAVLPTDRVYPLPAAAAAPSTPANGIVITMTAQQDCWVEVRADGTTVINRVLAEGESQTLEARGEIVLSVGNAGGLSLRVNDRPALPLGRSGEVRKNIVITRHSLPPLVEQERTASTDGRSG